MCEIPKNFVTSDLVYHLRCSKKIAESALSQHTLKNWVYPRFMFVFKEGDLDTAARFLAERMQEPFAPFPIASVAVEQSIHDEFIERVRHRFHQLKPHVAMHPSFERSLQELKMGGIKYVVAPDANAPAIASPVLVTDNVTHLFFSNRPSGMVILKGFTTIREAADIFGSDRPPFDAVYVFDESITSVYALASLIHCVQYFVNCYDVCMLPILSFYGMGQACSVLQNGYHYENVEVNAIWRMIVFPYSTTFVRRCCCPPGNCTCHIDHKVCCD